MVAMVRDVLSSPPPMADADQGLSVSQTHTMAPRERPSRSQIISDTMQFSRFKQ